MLNVLTRVNLTRGQMLTVCPCTLRRNTVHKHACIHASASGWVQACVHTHLFVCVCMRVCMCHVYIHMRMSVVAWKEAGL